MKRSMNFGCKAKKEKSNQRATVTLAALYLCGFGGSHASIDTQLRECHAYANAQGLQVIDVYVDEAGKGDRRKSFDRMLADCAERRFEWLIVYGWNRFAKSKNTAAQFKRKLMLHGVHVLSALEELDGSAENALTRFTLDQIAENGSNFSISKVVEFALDMDDGAQGRD